MTTLDVQWSPGRAPGDTPASALPVPGGQTLDPQVIDATFVDGYGDEEVVEETVTPEPAPATGNTATMLVLGGLALGGIYLLTRGRR